ncbi:glycosyl transferase family 1 [Telmatospirillum siberiense]|uniref:Glycosyl transferase family 1 n=1 Tax=Telmatospirillum siberiense TaxID=382514 RepID=A0A2N3PVU7_9PROT|nr:glycosyl transferase family 1 [Telmatospirillum siberiense]
MHSPESVENAPRSDKYRIAHLVSHPIQYHAPLLRHISAQPDIDLTVFFQSDLSLKGYYDRGFGRMIQWDVPLLDGYRHEFLPSIGRHDRVDGLRPISHGIATRLWRGNFDVLWVHGYARWFNWVAMAAARAASIPTLVRDDSTSNSISRSKLKIFLKRQIFFRSLGNISSGFLAPGTMNANYYIENGIDESKIYRTPYCVDNDYFRRLAEIAKPRREEFRTELRLEPGRPVILFASKLQWLKRAGDLLSAFGKITSQTEKGKKPYLLFVGDGEMREELENGARPYGEDVRFLGFRNQSELPAFFDLCDVFVLPSQFETWGLIINEVMNVGRPVIVSDRVGCGTDLVRDWINGFVYPAGNVDALAEALKNVLADGDRAAGMGRASRALIEQWSFDAFLMGLRSAIAGVTRRPAALA